jgi:hypothetical protein
MKTKTAKTGMYPKTKTWSPFKGCRFDCTYCAPTFKRQAKRQKQNCAQCYNYEPHYHEERLLKIPSSEIVFVCGNADISLCEPAFTRRIIDCIKQQRNRSPNKTFYFQSKCPAYFGQFLSELPDNVILVTTLETNRDQPAVSKAPAPSERYRQFLSLDYPRKVVTIEPIMDFDRCTFAKWIRELRPEYVWIGFNSHPESVTLPEPTPEKVQEFMGSLADAGIEVRGKELRGLAPPA